MKTLTVFCFLFAFLAFGQKAETTKMSREAASQAWAAVTNLPPDTPSIIGGGLVIESEPNGIGRRVWLSFSQPGVYLMRGIPCGGEGVQLGELYAEPNPYGPSNAMIYDGIALGSALPYFSPFCSIEVIHLDKGRLERSLVDTNPWQPPTPTGTPKFQVGGETAVNGLYQISVPRLPEDAIVILGRGATGKVATTPFGSTVTFPTGVYLPPAGPTTLTVCSAGRCTTTTFERRLVVEAPSGDKG